MNNFVKSANSLKSKIPITIPIPHIRTEQNTWLLWYLGENNKQLFCKG
jgi:hypothetical protein